MKVQCTSDFTEKLLNFDNVSLADNEIASLMDTIVHTEEPSSQTSTLFPVPITTIPPITHFFNPLPQQTTPTPTPTTSEATTSFPVLLDFASVFRFNDRVTKKEIYRYMDNKLGEAIHKVIQSHNAECREEAQAEKQKYIDNILPKAVSDFATSVIERNVTESLEALVLARSSSQPKYTYEAAASLSEYELTKILLDKIEERKSHLRAEYKKELYDALVKKSSKESESQKDPRSKEGKSTSSTKDTSRSHHKSFGKSAHAEEPSHTVDDSKFKKPERPLTPNPDWNKRQHVDFRPPQTWISVTTRAEIPPTSFDELTDTPIDFSAFVMHRLNIINLTQELLVGPVFNLLKGTCKSLTELKYHFEECSETTTERLDWYNPKGKPYPFDLRNPLPLIPDHRGHQVIPQDYFINNDLEYLKSRSLSKQYSTSVTEIKAAIYEIKWTEDLVPNL
ncbi:hypothetical protein Tco_0777931 [Tanacetum coccineum]